MTDAPEPTHEDDTPSKPTLKPFSIRLWLLSAIVIPSLAGVYVGGQHGHGAPPLILFLGVPALALFLHAKASTNIGRFNYGLGVLSFIGGWILMLGCFFFGCASSFKL